MNLKCKSMNASRNNFSCKHVQLTRLDFDLQTHCTTNRNETQFDQMWYVRIKEYITTHSCWFDHQLCADLRFLCSVCNFFFFILIRRLFYITNYFSHVDTYKFLLWFFVVVPVQIRKPNDQPTHQTNSINRQMAYTHTVESSEIFISYFIELWMAPTCDRDILCMTERERKKTTNLYEIIWVWNVKRYVKVKKNRDRFWLAACYQTEKNIVYLWY